MNRSEVVMRRIPGARLRALGLLILGSVACWTAGCGGPVVRGRLFYSDQSIPTAGDSVWVRRWDCDSCGATILKVKGDHSWEYNAKKGKNLSVWRQGAGTPPLGADSLTFQAVTGDYTTNIPIVTYLTHRFKDSVIVLTYKLKVLATPRGEDTIPPNEEGPQPY
jgi:hypothetical protein